MANGIKVVKTDDSIDSSNPLGLLYGSEFLSPKIYKQISGSIKTTGSGAASAYIYHDLSYSPVYLAYINPCRSIVRDDFCTLTPQNAWGLIDNNFAYITSYKNYLQLDLQDMATNATYQYVCFIFVEPA